MKILNKFGLEINIKITQFPDSQRLIDIPLLQNCEELGTATIIQSITNFADIELIANAVAALRHKNMTDIRLKCPYFLGARSDRAFTQNGVHYLRDVICPIINNMNLNKVSVLDPHSDVLEACLKQFWSIKPTSYIRAAILDMYVRYEQDIVLVFPDDGAEKRFSSLVQYLPHVKGVMRCSKHRDISNGNITSYQVPPGDFSEENLLVVDDLCDGGRTFIEFAKAIGKKPKFLGLYVTHGIFSKGFDELHKYYDHIYSTNSYCTGDFSNHGPCPADDRRITIFEV